MQSRICEDADNDRHLRGRTKPSVRSIFMGSQCHVDGRIRCLCVVRETANVLLLAVGVESGGVHFLERRSPSWPREPLSLRQLKRHSAMPPALSGPLISLSPPATVALSSRPIDASATSAPLNASATSAPLDDDSSPAPSSARVSEGITTGEGSGGLLSDCRPRRDLRAAAAVPSESLAETRRGGGNFFDRLAACCSGGAVADAFQSPAAPASRPHGEARHGVVTGPAVEAVLRVPDKPSSIAGNSSPQSAT